MLVSHLFGELAIRLQNTERYLSKRLEARCKSLRSRQFGIQRFPNVLWVQIYSNDGFVGLGETFYLPGAVEAVIHDAIAGFVLGRSPYDLESIWDQVFSYCNFFGYAGAEMRALSAVDIALWDLIGQKNGQPIYNLLVAGLETALRSTTHV